MSTKRYGEVGSSKEALPDDNTVLKITVEEQENINGRKRTSTMVEHTSRAIEHKTTAEKKQLATSRTPRNWGHILGKQNLQYMKQTQSCKSKQTQSCKLKKHTGSTETKKNPHVQVQRSNVYNRGNKRINATSPEKASSQRRSQEHSKTPCCGKPLTSMNSISSVYVQDRAVQCPEVFDDIDRFSEPNLLHKLRCSLKKLEDLVKTDKRTSEIFIEMEQTLSRIPVSSGKSIREDLENIALHSKLEESTAELKESNKMMKSMYKSWASKHEIMQSQIEKQDEYIKEVNQKQAELEKHVKILTQQSEEATRTVEAKEETISALKRQIKNDELSEKIISDLKTELSVQTELAHNRHNDIQYLEMEKDKLSTLSYYKDTLITEFRNTIIELQNQAKQLNEAYMNEGNASSQVSGIHTGPVCSSPNSRSSDHTNDPLFDHNISDISLSMVEHVQESIILKEDATVKDSIRFFSLPGEESSHTIIQETHEPEVTHDREAEIRNHNENNTALHRNMNANYTTPKEAVHHLSKKEQDKENNASKPKKFLRSDGRLNDDIKTPFHRNPSRILTSVGSNKPIVSDIEKQVQDMLDNMQNGIPVNVPSPLRDYPHPDWSDSTLSSVSTTSEVDIVPSNDV